MAPQASERGSPPWELQHPTHPVAVQKVLIGGEDAQTRPSLTSAGQKTGVVSPPS